MHILAPVIAVSPLRQRLIDDIEMRRFCRETQRNYIRDVGRFATFLGRSPDTATAEAVRRFQLEQSDRGVPVPTMNSIVSASRFFFLHTLDRPDLARKLVRMKRIRKLPVVLSPDEVARLLCATRCLKHQAALSVAYGAGLRAAEVAALKVRDVDSERMLLREWWKVGRQEGVMHPDGWLFPGQHDLKPLSTRQLHSIFVEAGIAAGIDKRIGPHTLRRCFATRLLEDGIDVLLVQALLGHAKLDTTAYYTKVATRTMRNVTSPLDKLKVMSAIEHCRTAVMSGHTEACTDCGHWRFAYNSCRNQHCPRCQGAAARTWLAEREADLLPVGYFHVVLTLPTEVGELRTSVHVLIVARGLSPTSFRPWHSDSQSGVTMR